MSVSFSRTRNQLATLVLKKLGVLAAGATADTSAASADADAVYEALDLRLKEMHRLGIFWRKVTSVPVTFSLTSSIVSASAGAGDILFPIKMTFTDGTDDLPVDIIGMREYAAIEDKTTSGTPTKTLWKGGTEFVFYPVPSANGTAKLLYEKIADDTSASAAVDVDVSMLRSLRDMICYDLGDHFAKPDQTMLRFAKEAEMAERHIRYLSAERVDYSAVKVDDNYGRTETRETDYGW